MCMTPNTLPNGAEVACRLCWQCIENRTNDYVGRCIAEQKHADKVYAVTLTYAGDSPNAATLVYKDFQDFMKKLRKKGYKVRYIVAGEYGKAKGRAHWHAVLFFKGKHPDIALDRRIQWDVWDHGFSYFQEPDYKGFFMFLNMLSKGIKKAHNTDIVQCPKNRLLDMTTLLGLLTNTLSKILPRRICSILSRMCGTVRAQSGNSCSKENHGITTSQGILRSTRGFGGLNTPRASCSMHTSRPPSKPGGATANSISAKKPVKK